MANPTLLTMPLCVNADKNTIPPTDAGTSGLFSEEYGWQNINSLPLASGGKAPNRRDFNGVFSLLGGIAYACQRGYTFEWEETQDYVVGCVVLDTNDNKRYECISDVTANATPPSADTTHWQTYGEVDISGKANVTLNNLDTANLSVHVVVDSYYNSATGDWYRVYDDGWVEQGGKVAGTYGNTSVVTYLKPMANINYTLLESQYDMGALNVIDYVANKTTTTATLNTSSNTKPQYYEWTVFGMGASA